MQKILFESKSPFKILNKRNKERFIFNFLNLYTLYEYEKNEFFKKSLNQKGNLNFIDSFWISSFLSLKYFKAVSRSRGPSFTRHFFENEILNKNKIHFFIGPNKSSLDKFLAISPHLNKENLFFYSPPYVRGKFSKMEINKISKSIKKSKADYVWLAISSPKQNILANDLFEKTNSKYFFNVGAAFDFILKKKKEAPRIIQQIGLEWIYRFITDFKHTKNKVWKSFIAIRFLPDMQI